jgi:Alpha amylase, catalytic domain
MSFPTNSPVMYEINIRCWLRELSSKNRRPIDLGNVPEPELTRWQNLGFTHIWLMGSWTTGPLSRARNLARPSQMDRYVEVLPDCKEEDVAGSPYAIAAYQVPDGLGGEPGLKEFRRGLAARGMKLILDFVSNHVGLDHPWIRQRPDLFVQTTQETPETFPVETPAGIRWFAHGKDPNFPAWDDTAQLEYRTPNTHAAMTTVLHSLLGLCDGVRCDMAMLPLTDVFAETWRAFPSPAPTNQTEFWSDAIRSVKKVMPDFLFLAEVYWDLEARLQSLGFDYTYDKRLYDYLVYRNFPEANRHLKNLPLEFINASAHFLENHDEPRIASILTLSEHRGAALSILGLPGLRLLHEGQLAGARLRTPVQLARRPHEPIQPEIAEMYEKLLAALQRAAVGRGKGEVLKARPAWAENPTADHYLVVQWQLVPEEFNLVVVNFAAHRSQCYAPLTISNLAEHNWQLRDLLGNEIHERRGDDLQDQGLYLDTAAHTTQLFHCRPVI